MLDEKLEFLIKKYHIYENTKAYCSIGQPEQRAWMRHMKLAIGLLFLAFSLNRAIYKINAKKIAVCCGSNEKLFSLIWKLILPPIKKKICYFITEIVDEKKYIGNYKQTIINYHELDQYPVDAVFVVGLDSMDTANICGTFYGKIVELKSIIYEKNLERYFEDGYYIRNDLYCDIYKVRHFRNTADNKREKMIWHQRLIAYYLMARDFLGVNEEICEYEKMSYEDAARYSKFWKELEKLFEEIKAKCSKRGQNDVFVFWLDQIEKENFYSMPWLGSIEGRIFHRAYTTMVNTTAVLYSILTNKNVKDGKLIKYRKCKKIDSKLSLFSQFPMMGREVYFNNPTFQAVIDSENDLPCGCGNCKYPPAMLGMWQALQVLCSNPNPCAIFFHFMETHNYYRSAVAVAAEGNQKKHGDCITVDYSDVAKKSREYIDRQLEWYNQFFSINSTKIYMSDHGGDFDLSERNVNIPLKVVGKGVIPGDEFRLFSHKNLYYLIDGLMSSARNIDRAFSNEIVIDVIDPYAPRILQVHKEQINHNELFEYKSVGKDELKKYIQATKIVTDRDEYYTINILGEESYYIGKDCQYNMVDESSYEARISELREMAGKFYNPWKEKKQVAIEFYEYLGIEEKDIINQCY